MDMNTKHYERFEAGAQIGVMAQRRIGGKQLNELYMTTAWDGLSPEQRQQYPLSGDLFYLQTDIHGCARRCFAG